MHKKITNSSRLPSTSIYLPRHRKERSTRDGAFFFTCFSTRYFITCTCACVYLFDNLVVCLAQVSLNLNSIISPFSHFNLECSLVFNDMIYILVSFSAKTYQSLLFCHLYPVFFAMRHFRRQKVVEFLGSTYHMLASLFSRKKSTRFSQEHLKNPLSFFLFLVKINTS